ncbi:STAS domain-containing protein [Magnetococcus sp. PR-3]|uniref:STAS domain-containing protein n=1 Tax=Magnetococcus sp. PR-3 TaxID=3120355 RepID=UPI002FCE1F1F
MTITIRQKKEPIDTVVITLPSEFKFNAWKEFMDKCEKELMHNRIEFDMRQVEYIDSAGLGMLLWAQNIVDTSGRKIHIMHCNERVKKLINVAHFERFFILEH